MRWRVSAVRLVERHEVGLRQRAGRGQRRARRVFDVLRDPVPGVVGRASSPTADGPPPARCAANHDAERRAVDVAAEAASARAPRPPWRPHGRSGRPRRRVARRRSSAHARSRSGLGEDAGVLPTATPGRCRPAHRCRSRRRSSRRPAAPGRPHRAARRPRGRLSRREAVHPNDPRGRRRGTAGALVGPDIASQARGRVGSPRRGSGARRRRAGRLGSGIRLMLARGRPCGPPLAPASGGGRTIGRYRASTRSTTPTPSCPSWSWSSAPPGPAGRLISIRGRVPAPGGHRDGVGRRPAAAPRSTASTTTRGRRERPGLRRLRLRMRAGSSTRCRPTSLARRPLDDRAA